MNLSSQDLNPERALDAICGLIEPEDDASLFPGIPAEQIDPLSRRLGSLCARLAAGNPDALNRLDGLVLELVQVLGEGTYGIAPIERVEPERALPAMLQTHAEIYGRYAGLSWSCVAALFPDRGGNAPRSNLKRSAPERARDRARRPHFLSRWYEPVATVQTVELIPAPEK